MAFHVEISPEAFENLNALSDYIEVRSSFRVAERWFNGILDAIRSLNEMPYRCPVAEESADLASEVRMLLYGKRSRRYKIYFAIHEETKSVRVFHVRHWAMKPVEADELADLMEESLDRDDDAGIH